MGSIPVGRILAELEIWMVQSVAVPGEGEINAGMAKAAPAVNVRFILCVGMIFVVNSHLKEFYPSPSFAGDGLLGYALFFYASGLGIGLSAQRKIRQFHDYYARRIMRIYPTLWLIIIPTTLIDWYPHAGSPGEWVRAFIFPTGNTFVGPMMIDYIILYIALRPRQPRWILGLILGLSLPFAILWSQTWQFGKETPAHPLGQALWWIANLQIMLLGAYSAFFAPRRRASLGRDVLLCVLVLGGYVGLKLVFSTSSFRGLFPLLFLVIWVLCILLFRVACSAGLEQVLQRRLLLRLAVLVIGGCSLELYFIHDPVLLSHWRWLLLKAPFPLGILAVWVISLPTAYLAERVAAYVRSGFRRFSWRIGPSGGG